MRCRRLRLLRRVRRCRRRGHHGRLSRRRPPPIIQPAHGRTNPQVPHRRTLPASSESDARDSTQGAMKVNESDATLLHLRKLQLPLQSQRNNEPESGAPRDKTHRDLKPASSGPLRGTGSRPPIEESEHSEPHSLREAKTVLLATDQRV